MKFLLLICAVFVLQGVISKSNALKNKELFNLVRPYATDIEEYDIDDDDSDALEENDVITLPGGPDDEVDFEYLLTSMGLMNATMEETVKTRNLLWWHSHHSSHQKTFHCSCKHDSCECCLTHNFRFNLIIKKFHFRLHACLTVAYRVNIGFELTFAINGHRLYHKEISLKHPPGLCFGVPGLKSFARVCLELYDINLGTKSLCARITGVLDIKIHKFKVHLKLGCMKIPILDKDAFLLVVNNPEFLQIQPINDALTYDVKSRDAVDIFRSLKTVSDDLELYEVN